MGGESFRIAVVGGSLLFVPRIRWAVGDRGHLPDSFQGAATVVKMAHPAVSGGPNPSLGTADIPARVWACLPALCPPPGRRQKMKWVTVPNYSELLPSRITPELLRITHWDARHAFLNGTETHATPCA